MLSLLLQKIRSWRESLMRWKRENYIEGLVNKGLQLGSNVQFAADVFLDPSHCSLIHIGSNVTFAPNVRVIAHDASTKQFLDFTRIGLVRILDDCFIGDSVIILPGVTIGPRAIVGAGSVVTGDVPENSVAAGYPARVISTLDEYLIKRKNAAKDRGVLGCEYWAEHLTEEGRARMLTLLSSGDGFIV
jgi:maltose O-acetyltransferase